MCGIRAAQRFASAQHGLKLGWIIVDLLQALNQLFCGFSGNGGAGFGDREGVGAFLAVRLTHQNQGQTRAQALGGCQAARLCHDHVACFHQLRNALDVVVHGNVRDTPFRKEPFQPIGVLFVGAG